VSLSQAKKNRYKPLWIVWIIAFFAIEGPAIMNKQSGDTLSEHVRSWFSIGKKSKGWRMRRLLLLLGLVWFPFHILTGGPDKDGWV